MEAQEGTFTLVRRFVGETVERELYANGKLVYSDRMSEKMFIYRLEHLDILSALEQFSFGECNLYMRKYSSRVEFEIKNYALTPLSFRHRIVRRIRNWYKSLR